MGLKNNLESANLATEPAKTDTRTIETNTKVTTYANDVRLSRGKVSVASNGAKPQHRPHQRRSQPHRLDSCPLHMPRRHRQPRSPPRPPHQTRATLNSETPIKLFIKILFEVANLTIP